MTTPSLRVRLTLWYTVALVVVLCLGGADVLWIQGRLGMLRVDRELEATAATLANVIRAELDEKASPAAAAEEARATVAVPGLAGGYWLATVGLRPITDMARQASALAPTGREHLAGQDRTDEIGLLARAFNGLLARLRTTLGTQRQFMADASHELRTPVSIIRTAADVALTKDRRTPEEYRETLAIIKSESERLSRLVADMLVLARADAGGYQLRPVDLYLDDIVADCQRAVAVLAAQRGVTVQCGPCPEVAFKGDEDLLRQL